MNIDGERVFSSTFMTDDALSLLIRIVDYSIDGIHVLVLGNTGGRT
jgi:hypothetical protein